MQKVKYDDIISGRKKFLAVYLNDKFPGGESVGMRRGFAPHFRHLDDLFAPQNLTLSTISFRSYWVSILRPLFFLIYINDLASLSDQYILCYMLMTQVCLYLVQRYNNCKMNWMNIYALYSIYQCARAQPLFSPAYPALLGWVDESRRAQLLAAAMYWCSRCNDG